MIYLQLFLEFLKIGLFTFGGGYAMIPLIKETVQNHNWLTDDQFLNMIGISEVTPGPIAVNMATYVGSVQGGFLGSLVATLGVILPAFIIMLFISLLLKRFMKNKYVKGALGGIKFVAIALIAASAITILADVLFPYTRDGNSIQFTANFAYIKIFIMVIAGYFLLRIIMKKKPGPILVILMSACVGLLVNYL